MSVSLKKFAFRSPLQISRQAKLDVQTWGERFAGVNGCVDLGYGLEVSLSYGRVMFAQLRPQHNECFV